MIGVHTLPNGLRIVLETIPFVRSVSFGIWIKNGSRNESKDTNGISHFIEHMMFKGTKNRTARQIADTMDAVGGQLNAFTSKEYTCFFSRTLDAHFDTALDVLQDMFFNSNYDEAEINKERGVILEELNMYEDTPEDLVIDLMQAKSFSGHPLGMTVVGTGQTINRFKQADFADFLSSRYTSDKIVVSVAGNIDKEAVLEKISSVFGNMQAAESKIQTEPAKYMPGFSVKDKDIEQVHLCLGFPGIPTGVDETYALAAVNTIFGGGMSSRLFQKIREEHGLVYSVYSYNISFIETGIFAVYCALNPAHIFEVPELIVGEIRGMLTDRTTEEELSRAKEQIKSNFLLSLENSSSRMSSIGRSLLLIDKVITPDELIAKIDNITLDDFFNIYEAVLKLDEISVSLVGKNVERMGRSDFERVFD